MNCITQEEQMIDNMREKRMKKVDKLKKKLERDEEELDNLMNGSIRIHRQGYDDYDPEIQDAIICMYKLRTIQLRQRISKIMNASDESDSD